MKPRPGIVSLAFATLVAIHAWWGVRMLLGSNVLLAGSQLVGAGGLVLAMVAPRDRRALGLAMGFMAAATGVRIFAGGQPPFTYLTLLLAVGFGAAAWATHRLDDGRATWEPLALRGGFVLAALAYAGFAIASVALGGLDLPRALDFAARILAALAIAAFIEAPPSDLTRRTGASGPSAAR